MKLYRFLRKYVDMKATVAAVILWVVAVTAKFQAVAAVKSAQWIEPRVEWGDAWTIIAALTAGFGGYATAYALYAPIDRAIMKWVPVRRWTAAWVATSAILMIAMAVATYIAYRKVAGDYLAVVTINWSVALLALVWATAHYAALFLLELREAVRERDLRRRHAKL